MAVYYCAALTVIVAVVTAHLEDSAAEAVKTFRTDNLPCES